jgi:hypothetical protein
VRVTAHAPEGHHPPFGGYPPAAAQDADSPGQ